MKKIIISAINLRSGGTLSILNDFMKSLISNSSNLHIEIILLCHSEEVLDFDYSKITIKKYPKSIKSYLLRIYYEYVHFYRLSNILKPDVWISLHDITPRVFATKRYVYCHNPSPFFKFGLKTLFLSPTEYLFGKLYKYLYRFNINKNTAVIVQQNWIAEKFKSIYGLQDSQIIVASPIMPTQALHAHKNKENNASKRFIFASLPRTFKNFEVILEAAIILNKKLLNFEVDITIDGTENRYSRYLFKKYSNVNNVKWVGLQDRMKLIKNFKNYDAMIFPSKLETYGLPIEEFKYTSKPIIVSDLPYAHETIDDYTNVSYFDPDDAFNLSMLMIKIIDNKSFNTAKKSIKSSYRHCNNWNSLILEIIKDDQ